MSLSVLWLISIIMFVVVALLQSRNRLFVYNIALSISLIFISSIYIIDKYMLGLKIATVISSVFDNMFSGIFASYNLSSLDLNIIVWAFSMLLFFIILYIFLLVLFKYLVIGKNPLLPYKKKDYFTHFLSSCLFVVCGFVISTFFFTFIKPITNIEYGFMSPLFTYLYGGVKL